MHFDLKTKSLAITDLELTLLIHHRSINVLPPLLLLSHRKAPIAATRVFPSIVPAAARGFPPCCAMGPGGALKLPQRVRAQPGRQTLLVILLSENEVWEAPKLSQQVRAEPGRLTLT